MYLLFPEWYGKFCIFCADTNWTNEQTPKTPTITYSHSLSVCSNIYNSRLHFSSFYFYIQLIKWLINWFIKFLWSRFCVLDIFFFFYLGFDLELELVSEFYIIWMLCCFIWSIGSIVCSFVLIQNKTKIIIIIIKTREKLF